MLTWRVHENRYDLFIKALSARAVLEPYLIIELRMVGR
jgi:hypothetical protein